MGRGTVEAAPNPCGEARAVSRFRGTAAMRTRLACVCAALATVSCGDDSTDPHPAWMEPSTGSSAASVPVVIHGERFLLRPLQEQSGGPAELEMGHRAWLGEVELVDVVWVDTRTLHATVPAGLAPGVKQLVVENGYGRRGALDRAFEVTAAPATALGATLGAPATFNVGQRAALTLSIRNEGEAAVRDVIPDAVALTGTAAQGAVVAGPVPASADRLEPGATVTFTWFVTAALPGSLSVATRARATDASSAEVWSPVAEGSAAVQTPARLAADLGVEGVVRVGMSFAVTLGVRDTGEAGALVTGVEPTVTPRDAATCDAPAPAPPQPVDGLGTVTFSWFCTPREDGTLTVVVVVAGIDANSGEALGAQDKLSVRVP